MKKTLSLILLLCLIFSLKSFGENYKIHSVKLARLFNDPPVASSPSISTAEDTPKAGLITATDADGDALTYTVITQPLHGGVVLNINGTYTYTPTTNYNGTDSFAIAVSDGNGGTANVTIPVVVTPVNDPPTANPDVKSVFEDIVTIVSAANGLVSNDTDIDGDDQLLVINYSIAGIAGVQFMDSDVLIPGIGVINIGYAGNYRFTPVANYHGLVPVITYTINDLHGPNGSSTSTLTLMVGDINDPPSFVKGADLIIPINSAPQTHNNWATMLRKGPANESSQLLDFILTNDKNSLFAIQPAIDANGKLTYIPAANQYGKATVTVQIHDNGGTVNGGIDISTAQTFVIAIKPVGITDTYTTTKNVPLISSVTSNDGASGIGTMVIAGTINPLNGSVIINPDGTIKYTPNNNYIGTDSYSYLLRTPDGVDSDPITVNIIVVNSAPVGAANVASTNEDQTLTVLDGATGANGDILMNDSDFDNDPLTVSSFTYPGINGTPIIGNPYLIPGVGSITINANGSYQFIPLPDYNGTVPLITYTITDGTAIATSTLSIIVNPVNDAPLAVANINTTPEDVILMVNDGSIGDILLNDIDIDGDVLYITSYTIAGLTGVQPVGSSVLISGIGTITIYANGSYTFVPFLNFNGVVPQIIYTASDGSLTATSTLNITVTPVNDLPIASSATITTLEDTPKNGVITATDADGDVLVYTVTTQPANGTVTLNGGGAYIYSPKPNFNGNDSFTVTISDGKGGTITITITVTVIPVNDAPIAIDNAVITNANSAIVIAILANDIKGDSNINPGSVVITQQPTNGTVSLDPITGAVTYTPNAGFYGTDNFKYTVKDMSGDVSNIANVSITVNQAPTAVDDNVLTEINTAVTLTVLANDIKYGSATIVTGSIVITQQPTNGILNLNLVTGVVTYTPNTGYVGTDLFKYTFKDSNGAVSNMATVTIIVTDKPKIGLAKAGVSTVKTINGSYDVTYLFTVKNYSLSALQNLSVKDDLKLTFKNDVFKVKSVKSNGALNVNASFNGENNTELLQPGNSLAVGKSETFELLVNVAVKNTSYSNFAIAEAISAFGSKASDQSTNGLKPDPDNVGDVSPALPTIINLTIAKEFISGGFSPNGDGINDLFKIENAGAKRISIEVFNRWGNRVYRSADYKNDWDGKSNEGIRIGGGELPEGTYFYIIILDGKDKYVGNITLKR